MAHYIYNWNGNKATLVSQNAYSLDEALNAIAALNAKAQDYDEVYSLAALSRNGEPAQTLYRLANGELSEIEESVCMETEQGKWLDLMVVGQVELGKLYYRFCGMAGNSMYAEDYRKDAASVLKVYKARFGKTPWGKVSFRCKY